MEFKVGIGYDVHRLVKGRKLILGGVHIPYSKGLKGHSDADVVLHAICDAILGALGKGDIGEHFPNTDARFKNISSLKLLKAVNSIAKKQGYKVNNVDTVILAQEPHLKDFKGQMRSHIASELAINETAVNIKATTGEGLGFIGQRQGLAAYATVSIAKK
jgi:2-C-methyl-D-erythritol 2,4-cyclodiphosphate synthase